MGLRAGDAVWIESINEEWLLAADERDGRVVCAGWPESMIESARCVLRQAATDAERLKQLRATVKSCGDQMRGSWARQDLAKTADGAPTPETGGAR